MREFLKRFKSDKDKRIKDLEDKVTKVDEKADLALKRIDEALSNNNSILKKKSNED